VTGVLFVHGWGLTPDLWDEVASRIDAPSERLDLGHFGAPRLGALPLAPFISVGHSFGCLWLLRHWPEGCAGLVSINGFGRFAAGAEFPQGAPRRPLDRMITRFAEDPDGVAAAFLDRCAAPRPARAIQRQRAEEGLVALRDWDERATCATLGVPIAALCGGVDPIVPPSLSSASLPGARLTVLEDQGHLLPLTAPDACAAAIAALAAEVST
jgi:pimeloyl-[acyl-carrier protein] methyl ester esterase